MKERAITLEILPIIITAEVDYRICWTACKWVSMPNLAIDGETDREPGTCGASGTTPPRGPVSMLWRSMGSSASLHAHVTRVAVAHTSCTLATLGNRCPTRCPVPLLVVRHVGTRKHPPKLGAPHERTGARRFPRVVDVNECAKLIVEAPGHRVGVVEGAVVTHVIFITGKTTIYT